MYTQKISAVDRGRMPVCVVNSGQVPKSCYCRFDDSSTAYLVVYAVSGCGKYMIAEGYSDRTAFVLLKRLGDPHKTEYVDCCYNPFDELYGYPVAVHWYEEYGFCKLEFFCMDTGDNRSKRMYFDRALYENRKREIQEEN